MGITCVSGVCSGRAWTQITTTTKPAARYGASLAFDSVRHKVVLFGGSNGSTVFGDTWEYDGTNWTLVASTGPSARQYAGLAYDPVGQRTLLYGGTPQTTAPISDMWSWNGSAWTQLSPTNLPPGRAWPGMVYDSVRQLLVLFGGENSSGTAVNETWEFNVATDTWAQNTPAGTPPARFVLGLLAYDPSRQRTVNFGGYSSGAVGQTLEYDGGTWATATTTGTPPNMWAGTMAFDPPSQTVVLVGGTTGGSTALDTMWVYSGGTWTQQTGPSARGWHAMTYDSFRGRLVVFGGWNTSPIDDTWEY